MTNTLSLAFYCGAGGWIDRGIRTATRSKFSHVELVADHRLSPNRSRTGFAISSSGRDGGVRHKNIHFEAGNWEFVNVEGWASCDAWARAEKHCGRPYDYQGILTTFALPLRRHNKTSWFCSELCAHALGLQNGHMYSPGDLKIRVEEMNGAYLSGLSQNQRDQA
jgi:hypothetical protein